ncbi:regulation of nuclear pre-mRNA domain-containing protein 1A-like [Zingiber officinale]|uniref:regulation of nuclear pre-mRNA domain-containing protein 1A-like n=1 Tax=Zingiber officinale TaxID=94328 RepID=UPI001C4CC080|nr:regulation of nuclear pre-mRNA domain-containing protein 1A-like [Zingiber officinale]XP_042378588.1 regulation of nuclear pre-mRNA domain-containing protein 1A-like [Zingiber officinale]
MNGSFNGQILVDKLTRLNNSQQSIETLSHWCIFHRYKAKQVVETWEQQFYSSPREQRVSFLYLANDILQNSRRKGLEFINEFWKVLPDALSDVFANGDDIGRKTVQRLVNIWEERKVFGSRGQILKEEILGRKLEDKNKNGKAITQNLNQSSGILEKIISSYDKLSDEDSLFGKCQAALNIIDKVEKELGSDFEIGSANGSEIIGNLQIQHGILGECIEQLKASELSRATLISYLREALNEQELKAEQTGHQLQVAELRCKQAGNILSQLNVEQQPPATQNPTEPLRFAPEVTASSAVDAQITLSRCTQEEPLPDMKPSLSDENRKTEAAAVAAKLTASASSAQMLSFVLSSLASEGVIGPANREESPDSKRLKLQNSLPPPHPLLQVPMPPPFSHPEAMHQLPPPQSSSPNLEPTSTSVSLATPSPSTSVQFMQSAAGPMTGVPYAYGSAPPPLPNYPMFGMHPNLSSPNPFYSFQPPEGPNLVVQPPLPSGPPPLTRQ